MGVNISDIVPKTTVEIEHLTGRVIAIDAYNTLYQFLSIIRQPDGTPLMNSKGEVTSHLTGLLYRTSKLVEAGVRPAFVFDGIPPGEKKETLEARMRVRSEAKEKWDSALERGDVEAARSYAQQATRLTKPMVEQAKELLGAMGIPWVQAPAEGEAQASVMCAAGDVWAVGSQDFDSLLFGTPLLIRNITVTGRRKLPKRKVYIDVKPESINLNNTLASLGIDRDQLIDLAIMVGTDYNEGIKGIGPKKALALVQGGKDAARVFSENGFDAENIQAIRDLFKHPDTTKDYKLEWKEPDREAAANLLVDRYEFSRERVSRSLDHLTALKDKATQSRLDQWS
jgi:flap endonuclease-1